MSSRPSSPTPPDGDPFAPLREAFGALPAVARAVQASGRCEIGGLWGSGVALAAAAMARRAPQRTVVVAATAEAAEALTMDVALLDSTLPVALLPAEESTVAVETERKANRSERLVALAALADDGPGLLVLPAAVLLEELPVPEGNGVTVVRGGTLERDRLLDHLLAAGYEQHSMVAAPGEVSVRGDILDVYPWVSTAPVRIELFDDEVEDLRHFDIETQRSIETLDLVTLHLGDGKPGATRRWSDFVDLDRPLLVVDGPRVRDRLVEVAFEHDVAPREVDDTLASLSERPGADLSTLSGDPETDAALTSVGGAGRPLEEALGTWRDDGRQTVLLGDSEGENERLTALLASRGVSAEDSHLTLVVGRVTSGFALPAPGPVLAQHHELIGRRAVRRARHRRAVASRAIGSVRELHPGDAVVHLTHGVALYRGTKRMAREQGEEDFLVLEFDGGTTLFVPASRIDLVERYIGGDARTPKLDKIGGKSWARKKNKVAAAVADLAAQLLELAASRSGGEGYAHPHDDDGIEARFAATFPYQDTPDQGRSWIEVAADMQTDKPMDRLLVGDVGFGKTEVAVRAAYKTVVAGKQVAILVPTTILAEQHHETFAHRMAEEPLRIEVLSRFRTAREQKQVLADAAAGKVDILVGTHRLLSKDVAFRDLGLVVVDEEHRFGVAHKEKLKRLRASVDVLTLSATPIPRTLHMAMSGLRDISSIETPPPGRRPVVTKVGHDDDAVLRSAILHELDRGGQVFVLHNRVATLGRVLERVAGLLPTARVAEAHGQMLARDLQDTIERFSRGDLDVLVCTTIIESGVDIPRANTLIVTDADRYGLADLHQLRGRVGREREQAYAFFLTDPGKPLADRTQRRLKAIEEWSSLGAGMPIALRDLELRGAGNLLGAEQSGHVMAVGYDVYCRLLRNAVESARGHSTEEEPGEIEVELGLTAYLPSDYVPNEGDRMSLLRRLARAGKRMLVQIEREIVDRFGRMPEPARELIELFRLRRLVRLSGVASIQADGLGGAVFAIGNEKSYGKRGPFMPPEAILIDEARLRVPWPRAVTTPRERLAWLLERFEGGATPVVTAATRRRSRG